MGAWSFGCVIALTLSPLPANISALPASGAVARRPLGPQLVVRDTLPNLSAPQTDRVRKIVLMATNGDSALTPSVRQEFWDFLDKVGSPGRAAEEIRDRTVGLAVTYPLHVYRDALALLQGAGPAKSPSREACEKRLMSLHLLTAPHIKDSDDFVRGVAARDSVVVGGRKIVLAEELLRNALTNLEQANQRLDLLFGHR